MYCYAIPPIDHWFGWMTYKGFCASVARDASSMEDAAEILARAAKLLRAGRQYAKKNLLWEGDIVTGPRFSMVPHGGSDSAIIIAWKQSNNGTTFVVSEHELPWLA